MLRPHVGSQVAGLRKRLATRLADVWTLPRMCQHVLSQVVFPSVRIAARLADIRLLPRMRSHVLN